MCTVALASFPGLPCVNFVYFQFAFTIDRRRPGSIHHVNDVRYRCEVVEGGGGAIFKYVRTELESEFLTAQDEQF